MTRRGCIWGWLIGVGALLVIFLITIVAVESLLGERVSFPAYGARVGLVRIEGVLESADGVIDDLKAMQSAGVSALVLRIESPGGGVAASQEIYDYLVRLRDDGMPLVVSMGAIAASGGYYVACPADSIIANAGTLTGSIGVVMSFTNMEELFGKIGLDFEVIKSGRYKDTGSWSRSMTDEERALLQGTIDDIHSQFVETVALERGMEVEAVEKLADGRIFSGRQAVEAELVDGLGTLEDALAVAGRMAGITGKPRVQEPVRYKRLTLLDLVAGTLSRAVGRELAPQGAHYLYSPAK
jgi:protease-4